MTKFRYNGKDKAFAQQFAHGGAVNTMTMSDDEIRAATGQSTVNANHGPKNPFEHLGLPSDATNREIRARAAAMRGKLSPEETMDAAGGEAGQD